MSWLRDADPSDPEVAALHAAVKESMDLRT